MTSIANLSVGTIYVKVSDLPYTSPGHHTPPELEPRHPSAADIAKGARAQPETLF